jgi:hypothetical protein
MLLSTAIWPVIFSSLVFAIIFFYCILKIILALKRGYINYSGNRPSMTTSQRYSRKNQPFMFWIGIIAFSIPAIALFVLALAFLKII